MAGDDANIRRPSGGDGDPRTLALDRNRTYDLHVAIVETLLKGDEDDEDDNDDSDSDSDSDDTASKVFNTIVHLFPLPEGVRERALAQFRVPRRTRFRTWVDNTGTDVLLRSKMLKQNEVLYSMLHTLQDVITFIFQSPVALAAFCGQLIVRFGNTDKMPEPQVEAHFFGDPFYKFRAMKLTGGILDEIKSPTFIDNGGSSTHGQKQNASDHVRQWVNVIISSGWIGKRLPINIILHQPWLDFKAFRDATERLRLSGRKFSVQIDASMWGNDIEESKKRDLGKEISKCFTG